MKYEHRSGRANHVLLTHNVLIARNRRFAHHPKMRARQKSGPAHGLGHLLREVKQLDIECHRRIDGRVLMIVLRRIWHAHSTSLAWWNRDVQEVMIKYWSLTQQALNRT